MKEKQQDSKEKNERKRARSYKTTNNHPEKQYT
jgi:hypothetical protein